MITNYVCQGFAWRCLAMPAALVLTMLTSHAHAVCPADAAIDVYVADFAARFDCIPLREREKTQKTECSSDTLTS